MNQGPGQGDGWRGPGAGHQQNHSNDQSNQPQAGRPFGGGFGLQQQGPPQQAAAPVLPPPSYHHATPSAGHSLPALADMTSGASTGHHQPSPYNTHPPPPGPGHSLPGLGQQMPHQSPQSYINREMHELREREMRERELQRHQEQDMIREQQEARDRHDREHMERMHREQQQLHAQQQHHPVQSHTGSIPIHQPVASKVPNSIHGPNGLLSNIGSGPGPAVTNPPPSNIGGSNPFGISSQQPEHTSRQTSFLHQSLGPALPQSNSLFMGAAAPAAQTPAAPAGAVAGPSPMSAQVTLGQGQQPILNDALSYLDQVKVRFSDSPDVYNRFLDIMKDFKSQAIDTPGVIERVSNLFNGHPALIQGFNTFLPPGYRIECGTDENPDAIRVTTPSGTMTQSLNPRSRGIFESSSLNPLRQPSLGRQDTFEGRPGWSQPQRQYSPSARSANLSGYGQQSQANTTENLYDQDAANAALVHQQEQRGVSQLQNAVTVATNGNTNRPAPMMQTSPGLGQPATLAQPGALAGLPGQQGDMKRGPVEFNHAISYVNKIKTRFAQQPEIYKQFLEILQTYQRESKPIQDVYAQVTQLFNTAPDLLEDFKQFLPESAAHAKAQAAARAAADEGMTSNIRGDSSYASGQIAQAQTPRPAAKMPPMGQFDPPSTSKENKKRRGGPATQSSVQSVAPTNSVEVMSSGQRSRIGTVQVGNANKRAKLNNGRAVLPEAAPVSPSLVPQLPEPLPPLHQKFGDEDEVAFFERIKKAIGNKAIYTEFLKLVNLFSQDLIDKHVLLDRANAFIGHTPDLMAFLRDWMGVETQEDVFEARTRPDPGRVNLAHARSYGPSYRNLPKEEQNKICKGRDYMCYQVLNDVWASHPTWASEDSGFVAHRKNQYEETLHRVEEERHDYDYHIEIIQRTIQLMEPLVKRISEMDQTERANFVCDRALGGPSEAIPKRIIMKLYGRAVGGEVLDAIDTRPTAVLPVLLNRLKQKLEEWRQSQREWEKLWLQQTNKSFWRSLDHQGINAKNQDKKTLKLATLKAEIEAKHYEQKISREAGFGKSRHQLEYDFDDDGVIQDAVHLILSALARAPGVASGGDRERMAVFLKTFVAKFFELDSSRLNFDSQEKEPSDGDDEDGAASDEISSARGRTAHISKADSLRRDVLERRNGKERSVVSGSKESTPAATATSEQEIDDDMAPDVAHGSADEPERKWVNHKFKDSERPRRSFELDELYRHTVYNLYCDDNIYAFIRLFEILYSRLLAVKQSEAAVHDEVAKVFGDHDQPKAAMSLRMLEKLPDDFFGDVSSTANYYQQVIYMCHAVITKGDTETKDHFEETMRRFYLQTGWQLYSVDKLLSAIISSVMSIESTSSKDRSAELIAIFYKDREKLETSRAKESQYRKQVEKIINAVGDGPVYRVAYNVADTKTTIRIFKSAESTFDNDTLSDEARWQYYIASWQMTEVTEGIDESRMRRSFLRRTVQIPGETSTQKYDAVFGALLYEDDQYISIDQNKYAPHYEGEFYQFRELLDQQPQKNEREERKFKERFVEHAAWMNAGNEDETAQRKMAWQTLKDGM